MTTHFPTVPIKAVPKAESLSDSGGLRPVVLVVDNEPVILYPAVSRAKSLER